MDLLELREFMDKIGAGPAQVSRATKLHAATICRVRDHEQKPDGETIMKLDRWAAMAVEVHGLPADTRLSWEWLLE